MPLFLKILIAFLPFIKEVVVQTADTRKERKLRVIILALVLFILVAGSFAVPYIFDLVLMINKNNDTAEHIRIEQIKSEKEELQLTYDLLIKQMTVLNGEYLKEKLRVEKLERDVLSLSGECKGRPNDSNADTAKKRDSAVYKRLNDLKNKS